MPPSRKRKSDWPARFEQAKRTAANAARAARLRARVAALRNPRIGRGPVPPQTLVWLRYVQDFNSSATVLDQVFNLNSIFDPDSTGTGHQPLGRDQWATFYNRYRVTDTVVKIVAQTDQNIAVTPMKMIIVADNDAAAYTNDTTMSEQFGAFTTLVPLSDTFTFKRKYHLATVTGVTDAAYEDDRFQALMSATPGESIVLHVGTCKNDGSAGSAGQTKYTVQLDFRCVLWDPNTLAAS